MENTEITAAVNNTNNNGNNSVPTETTPRRGRERGNFTGRRMNSFDQLDPSQYPRKREEYIPMWAQEMKAQIDLLSQEQQKLIDLVSGVAKENAAAAAQSTKDESSDNILKELKCFENNNTQNFNYVLSQQSSDFQGIYNGLKDIHNILQLVHAEMHPRSERTLAWKLFHPIAALKEWLAETAKERKKKKAEKLQQQLNQLRGEL